MGRSVLILLGKTTDIPEKFSLFCGMHAAAWWGLIGSLRSGS
jgi:hypothetical protein